MNLLPLQDIEQAFNKNRNASEIKDSVSKVTATEPEVKKVIEIRETNPARYKSVVRLLLLKACTEGHLDVVNMIIPRFIEFVDIDQTIEYEAKNGLEVAKICSSSPIKKSFCRTSTFLHLASENGHYEIATLLVENGSKVDCDDCCGRSPLMVSIKHPKIAKFLIRNGASVNHQDKEGCTPLILMVSSLTCEKNETVELFEYFLKSGANPNLTDHSGQTVLHHALSKASAARFCKILFHLTHIPTCNEAGMLIFAGKPLCWSHVNHQLLSHLMDEEIPSNLKLSLKYFSFICRASKKDPYYSNDELLSSFKKILDFEKGKCKDVVSTASRVQVLVIAERVCGYGSYKLIELLLSAANIVQQRYKISLSVEQKVDFLFRASEMILFHVKNSKIDWIGLKLILLALDPKVLPSVAELKHDFSSWLLPYFNNIFESISVFLTGLRNFHCHHHSLVGSFIQTAPHHHDIKSVYWKSLTLASHILKTYNNHCDVDEIGRLIFSVVQPVWLPDIDMSIFPWFFMPDKQFDALFPKALEWGAEKWINVPNTSQRYLLHFAVKQSSDYPKLCLLLQHGAHPDVCGGRVVGTPMKLAKKKKNEKAIKLLRQYYPLSLACQAACIVAREIDNYHLLDLPKQIKIVISLHDSHGVDKGIDYSLAHL